MTKAPKNFKMMTTINEETLSKGYEDNENFRVRKRIVFQPAAR